MARRLATHGLAVLRDRAVRGAPERRGRRSRAASRTSRTSTTPSRWTCSRRPPTCSSSKTTSPGSRCSASAWAATTCSRPRRSTGSTRRSRSTACCARPKAGAGPGHRIDPLAVAARDGADARVLRHERSVDARRPTSRRCERRGADATDCEIVVVEGAEHGFVHDPDREVHRPDDAAARSVGSAHSEWIARRTERRQASRRQRPRS